MPIAFRGDGMNEPNNRRNRRMDPSARTGRHGLLKMAIWVGITLAPPVALGQTASEDSLLQHYVKALHQDIEAEWIRPESVPLDAACPVKIRQLPGGMVVSVEVMPECGYDANGKDSVQRAVVKASPLPYRGFESVFNRNLLVRFRASDVRPFPPEVKTSRPRQRIVEGSTGIFGEYVEACARTIETARLPRGMERPRYRERMAAIAFQADGRILEVMVLNRPKDAEIADDYKYVAALKAVAACRPFTAQMRADTDVITAIRTFKLRK